MRQRLWALRVNDRDLNSLRDAIYTEMVKMLARNARGAPSADELPMICDVMVDDYLRLPGVRSDIDRISRILAAFRSYVQSGQIDFPGLSHLIPFLPRRTGAFRSLPVLPAPENRDIGPGGQVWRKYMEERNARSQN